MRVSRLGCQLDGGAQMSDFDELQVMLMPVWAGREVLGRLKVQDGVSRSATAVLTFIGANLNTSVSTTSLP